MQWYKINDDLYKRELGNIEQHNNTVEPFNRVFWSFLDNNNFFVWFKYGKEDNYHIIFIIYPSTYPEESPIIWIYKVDFKRNVFEDWYSYQWIETVASINSLDSGFHIENGIVCYCHDEDWDPNLGIEYLLRRTDEWFRDGRYIKENDGLVIPKYSEKFIICDVEPKKFSRNWGLFDYQEIHDETNLIKRFYYSKSQIGLALPETNEIISIINIPESLNQSEKELKKGIFVIDQFDFYKKYYRPSTLLTAILRNNFPCGPMGFWKLAKLENIDYPLPILILGPDGKPYLLIFEDYRKPEIATRSHYMGKIEPISTDNVIFSITKEKNKFKKLRNKKVALIGLGAIGSVITTELTRSGIYNLLLVDPDKLECKNIGRHDLTIKDVGKYKVEAIREKLLDINPDLKKDENIKVHKGLANELLRELKDYDLIICTIDKDNAKFGLNSLLTKQRKKILYVNAFYDSIAGFAYLSDKRQACYSCFSSFLDDMVAKKEMPDFAALAEDNSNYGCGEPTIPGGSIDTHTIALLGARVALDYLLDEREMDDNNYPYNFFLVGNKQLKLGEELFFNGMLDIKKYVVGFYRDCYVCGNNKASELNEEAKELTKVAE